MNLRGLRSGVLSLEALEHPLEESVDGSGSMKTAVKDRWCR